MGKKIKVCCFCEKWESGGIESFLANVIRHFDMKKFQVDIVSVCLCPSIFTPLLQDLGVRFFELSGRQRSLIQNYRLFFALLQREQYDIVHFNLFHGLSLVYVRIARKMGVPMRIAHSHNTALRKSITRPLKQMLHYIAKKAFTKEATDLWACSKSAAEFLFSKTVLERKGFRFIPNGIEIERFRFDPQAREQVRAELGLAGKFVIGNVGRLCYQKNQSFLLDVFAQVKQRKPESCLLLVGEGELLKELTERAQRLGIANSVILYGVTSHVERLLWAMDVFVMPSRFEGLPVTSIEAQASGVPCIFSEAVTKECTIVRGVRFLPLSAPVSQWAQVIIHVGVKNERTVVPPIFLRTDFDMDHVAREIANHYWGVK